MNAIDMSETESLPGGTSILIALPVMLRAIPAVKTIRLLTIKRVDPIRDRLPQYEPFTTLFRKSSRDPVSHRASTWWSLLHHASEGSCTDESRELLLREASYHAAKTSPLPEPIDAAQISQEVLSERIDALPHGRFLAISSAVTTRTGQKMQWPLLDFALPFSAPNTRVVTAAASQLGLPHVIFRSEHSYHYYGLELLTFKQYFGDFLGRAALLAPLVDARWIAHQLIDSLAALRLSSQPDDGCPPELVSWSAPNECLVVQ